MTLDSLTTAARAAGFALAGDPQDLAEREERREPARLPAPTPRVETKVVRDMGWLRDWFAPKVARASA